MTSNRRVWSRCPWAPARAGRRPMMRLTSQQHYLDNHMVMFRPTYSIAISMCGTRPEAVLLHGEVIV